MWDSKMSSGSEPLIPVTPECDVSTRFLGSYPLTVGATRSGVRRKAVLHREERDRESSLPTPEGPRDTVQTDGVGVKNVDSDDPSH